MSGQPDAQDEDYLSPRDISSWAHQEIKNAGKAFELRVKELTDLAFTYSAGEITPEQADEKHSRYYHRWGEALLGTTCREGVTDEHLLLEIDKAAGSFTPPLEAADKYRRLFHRSQRSGSPKR